MPKSKSSGKQPITYSSNNLTHAVGKGDLALIKKCLSHGVNVNTRDTSGWLPLHWLRTSTPNQEAILRLLVAQGANLFLGSRKKYVL